MNRFFLAIDIGGTKFTLAVADAAGKILKKIRRQTDASGGAQAIVREIVKTIPELIRLAQHQRGTAHRIGISFGGPVEWPSGRILLSHHVSGWEGLPLGEILEARFRIKTVIDNDCNAGALGELRFGAGRGHQNLIYLNLGTGIGGGVISNGQILRGANNLTGEIGHVTIDPDGPLCTCGRRGCLESLASGPSLAERARQAGHGQNVTSEKVFAAARSGKTRAKEIVAEAAEAIAQAIGTAVCLLNPSLVIIGGGISEVGELLLRPIQKALPKYALDLSLENLKLVRARLGYDSGIYGAIALAMGDAENCQP